MSSRNEVRYKRVGEEEGEEGEEIPDLQVVRPRRRCSWLLVFGIFLAFCALLLYSGWRG